MQETLPVTLTDRMREFGYGIVNPMGKALYRLGVHPDLVTILGCGLVLLAGIPIGQGQLQVGAVLLLLALPCDVLDGAVARAMERKGQFGAVLDSSLDRYADGFIFAALSYYFAVQGRTEWIIVAQAAMLGTFMVSYIRARAESVGVIAKIGLLSRMERSVIIIPMLLFPVLLEVLLLVLAIGTNVTTLQRLWFVYRTLRDRGN